MTIQELEPISGKELPLENLLSYLSDVVLSKTDIEIKGKKELVIGEKVQLNQILAGIAEKKQKLSTLAKERTRLVALNRVLLLISDLQREGVLVGNNKTRILKVLDAVDTYDFLALRKLEDRLSVYLPENRS